MSGWEPKVFHKHGTERDEKGLSRQVGEWVIESGIPIPPTQNGKRRTGITPALRSMDVGDSVLVKDGAAWVASRISAFHAMSDMRFTTRATEDGMRIWRVE